MGKPRRPFHTKDYTYDKEKKKFDPLLEVLVGSKESKKKVIAYADTGCDTCMHFCKSYFDKEALSFMEKISTSPVPFGVADGHIINGDCYKAICQINGEEKEIIVSVIDPETFFKEEEAEIEITMPLIGRGILDEYDVLFRGKKRKIAIFQPK